MTSAILIVTVCTYGTRNNVSDLQTINIMIVNLCIMETVPKFNTIDIDKYN